MHDNIETSPFSQMMRLVGDFVFPPSPDMLTVRTLTSDDLLALQNHRAIESPHTILPYREPSVRACIHQAKFHRNTRAFMLLSDVLAAHLINLPNDAYTLVPIPLSRARFRERGYNQVTEVARLALSNTAHIILEENILCRTRHTKPQTDIPREARLNNVANAFGVRDPHAARRTLGTRHVILLDDVYTTGATMHAAAVALRTIHPASLTCVTLAG